MALTLAGSLNSEKGIRLINMMAKWGEPVVLSLFLSSLSLLSHRAVFPPLLTMKTTPGPEITDPKRLSARCHSALLRLNEI
jgi:hypothetical protein